VYCIETLNRGCWAAWAGRRWQKSDWPDDLDTTIRRAAELRTATPEIPVRVVDTDDPLVALWLDAPGYVSACAR
jgi:hypothetical protein